MINFNLFDSGMNLIENWFPECFNLLKSNLQGAKQKL